MNGVRDRGHQTVIAVSTVGHRGGAPGPDLIQGHGTVASPETTEATSRKRSPRTETDPGIGFGT